MSQNNSFCWVDIPVLDLDRAISFYSAVTAMTIQKIAEHGFEFGLFPHTEDSVSGCLVVIEGKKPSQNGPLVYLNAEGRLDQAISAAEKNGGSVLSAKEQIGPYGHRAVILDTEGNAIALYSREA
ncbi:MAG: VOC family protein [Tatlockia sp.]|nr:VOC family protein [Tatlockia sp.]